MSPVAPDNLFPLPLTAFERFMISDESTDYPMVFYLQVRLRGIVDREVLSSAVSDALSRHPLLCSHLERTGRGSRWVWAGDEIPVPDWDRERWMAQQPWNQPIDLTKNIGLRVWGEQHPDHAVITMQFHHACCDGIGAAQFLEDVAIGYARHHALSVDQQTDLPELRPLDAQLLKRRNHTSGRRIADVPGSAARRVCAVIKYSVRYMWQKKMQLRSVLSIPEDDRQRGLGLTTARLTRAETRSLRNVAKHNNATINDVLVRDLMRVSQEWNSNASLRRWRIPGWRPPTYSVLVPTSLRGPNDGELPACNVVSYIFMERSPALVTRPRELLESLRDEMRLVHDIQSGWMFIQVLEAMGKVPGLLRMVMSRTARTCMSTTVLSHMGNTLNAIGSRLPSSGGYIQMGNLLVEDVCGIPPLRKGTTVAFSSIMIKGCLAISMRCCSLHFSQRASESLLNKVLGQLRHTAAAESGSEEASVQSTAHVCSSME